MGGLLEGAGGIVDNTLGTNIFGQNANDKAAAAQGRATDQANSVLGPYSQVGSIGLAGLSNSNIFGEQGFQGDPGYQFRLGEGNKAINAGLAARGLGNSGAALKELTRYGQNFASNEYNNAYNREFNRLNTLAGIGQNAATGISNNYLGLGNAQAAAAIGRSNQTAQTLGGVMSMVGGMGDKAGGAGALFSDKRLKTEIKEISPEEIQEFRNHLKPYLFKYLSEEYGSGVWAGVMAQDLEKSKLGRTIVFENEKGEKQIDIKKAVSLLLALEAGV